MVKSPMNLEFAVRSTEILVGCALFFQCVEHLLLKADARWISFVRLKLSLLIILGVFPGVAAACLLALGIYLLKTYQGPYNGGSDRLSLLILFVLAIFHFAPTLTVQEFAFAYLGLQVVLSYFVAGLVKLKNPEWRSGRALSEILSRYGRSLPSVRTFAWVAMMFEILLPLTLSNKQMLIAALSLALMFHVGNFVIFGLNRFVWVWLASYPAVLWIQQRIFDAI